MRDLRLITRQLLALLAIGFSVGCVSSSRSQSLVSSQPTVHPAQAPEPLARDSSAISNAVISPNVAAGSLEQVQGAVQPAGFLQVTTSTPYSAAGAPEPVEVVTVPDAEPSSTERPTLPLDLPAALGLTQGQNPRVAFAQAQVAQAYAQYEAAQVLWLPSLRAGMNYNKHEGRLQDVEGSAFEISRGAAFGGFGANAVGAGSPTVPGVYAYFHAADAIYQRRISEYALDAREYQATAVNNDQLLDTAITYVSLLEAAQRKAIATETLKNSETLAKLTAEFVRTGAGNQADADRAATALSALQNEVIRAEEAATVASARMAQQLSADPQVIIVPQEPSVVPIDLVAVDELALPDLVATGLTNRPELAANSALVCEAVNRLRREERAPLLPSVLLGVSYGAFGAGTGGDITNGGDRIDFDAAAWWEVRNLGFGERAARDNARAQIQQARMREIETMDLVAREIVEAHAQVHARRRQITFAEQGILSAQQSYKRNVDRIQNAQGLPIEVLQAIQALDAAQRDYLRTIVDYNTAQFRLQRALGWPIHGA